MLQRRKLRREKGMGLRRRAGYVMEEEMLADFIQKEVEENEKRRRKKHTSLVVIVRQVPAWSVRPALSLCSPPLAKVGRKMRVHPQKQRPFVSTPAAMANSSSGLFPILNLFFSRSAGLKEHVCIILLAHSVHYRRKTSLRIGFVAREPWRIRPSNGTLTVLRHVLYE